MAAPREPDLPNPDRPLHWLAWVGLAALVVALVIGLVLQLQLNDAVDRIDESVSAREHFLNENVPRARQAICNALTYQVLYVKPTTAKGRLDRQELAQTIGELDCPPGIVPLPQAASEP